MEFTLVHLYPDTMNLYGEYANVRMLQRRLTDLGATVFLREITPEDGVDVTDADLLYMGAGTEHAQKWVLRSLAPHAEKLKEAVEHGAVVLFTGNAMECWGSSVTDQKGQVWHGLSLADFSTVETEKRIPHDVIAKTPLLDAPVVGFMNKCSVTAGITKPLFPQLLRGTGNEKELGSEGFCDGNVFLTHLTGPILAKNPHVLELIVQRMYAAKNAEVPESSATPWLSHAKAAYEVTLRELGGQA